MNLDGLVMVPASALYVALKTVQWCLEWELISPVDLPKTTDRRILDAAQIGLQCSADLPKDQFVLVSEVFAYQLKRSIDLCKANQLESPEQVDKKEAAF
jgi:hypothetical protein